eukprot:gnl/TRDRNA2_/TRDRNA2_85158_c0_seq1.p1 gnl/TRDRNA2_/TRDRNA2_85158_c0~~gnl/TRDRNA2_/TRDRNA2_85158_c0_seq1.p1  ORF type:complete len:190 (+),score=25.65 gnl/TRDRNA2_/TRDRNA2_85158_c0_seq1:142-711(+)
MVAPQEPGPCEGRWQLEAANSTPLSPPLFASATVRAVSGQPHLFASQATPQSVGAEAGYPSMATHSSRAGAASPGGAHASRAGATTSGGADGWPEFFEEFFGPETSNALRTTSEPDQQMHRMINQVWEYMKRAGLHTTNETVSFDKCMLRLFMPVLAQGQRSCKPSDLLPLVRSVCHKYLQARRCGIAS